MDVGNEIPLTRLMAIDYFPECSPNGRWLAYLVRTRSGNHQIDKINTASIGRVSDRNFTGVKAFHLQNHIKYLYDILKRIRPLRQ